VLLVRINTSFVSGQLFLRDINTGDPKYGIQCVFAMTHFFWELSFNLMSVFRIHEDEPVKDVDDERSMLGGAAMERRRSSSVVYFVFHMFPFIH
jgi:hypothetical protein